MERTLVLIKPDGVIRSLVGEILSRLEKKGLKLVALKMVHLDRPTAERLYEVHRGKDFFPGLVEYICSAPVVAAVFEGKAAISVVRQTMGETNPAQAAPGTIRGDLALDTGRNLIHGSDSPESAQREIEIFFSPSEILSYEREWERWLIEA